MKRRSFKITLYNNVYSQLDPPETTATRLHSSPGASCEFGIYRYVFTSKMAILAASLLCISLLLQPVASTYAQEIEEDSEQALSGSAANIDTETEEVFDTEVAEDSQEPQAENLEAMEAETDEEVVDEEELTVVVDESTETEEVIGGADAEADVSIATTATEIDDGITDAGTESATSTTTSTATSTDSTDDASDADDTTTTGGSGTSGESDDEDDESTAAATSTATSTENIQNDEDEMESEDEGSVEDDTETSTSTATSTGETIFVSNVQTDNTLAFGKNECTEVADGSYYCQKLSLENLPEDALFAAPDSTGDMEIFVVQEGIERKVTDNTVDDASPYYDARSETLVWHRLIQDRYQIISYDIDSGEETTLTDTKVNNMEPTRSGRYTVWQRWVKNNWEIILFDGENEQQLTDSAQHDIAPHIHGDLIIWNVRSSDGTESLMTYNIVSENYNEIDDPDGVSVANPRMLVMYEAQYQNEDTVMKGFDIVTGEIVPIESLPRELPEEIPSPETTGEVRALPTNPQTEQEIVIIEDPDSDPDGDLDIASNDSADLDLATSTATTTDTTHNIGTTTTSDLDLRPVDSDDSTTTTDRIVEQATIPDVVIPEFDATTTDSAAASTQES